MAKPNQAQADYWKSSSGRKWATHQDLLDSAFKAVNAALLERAQPRSGEQALDIGCGTGAASTDFAEMVQPGGTVLALDISPPLLEQAKANMKERGIGNVEFLLADAQIHEFEPGRFDLLFSRFGVMFFEDAVAAFANMRRAVKPGGRLAMAAWREPDGNPWFEIPRDAAIARLGRPPPADPRAPSPWAFAEPDYVEAILHDAGWLEASCETQTVEFNHAGPAEDMARLASNIGPAARIMKYFGGTEADQDAITEASIERFLQFQTEDGTRIPAKLNFLSARSP